MRYFFSFVFHFSCLIVLSQRKETLGVEIAQRGKSNEFIDKRFGEGLLVPSKNFVNVTDLPL